VTGQAATGQNATGQNAMQQIAASRRRGVDVIAVAGDLDIYTGPDLAAILARIDAAGRHRIVIDLSACGFLDPHGLGLIADARKRAAAAGGRLEVAAGASEPARRMFRLAGLLPTVTLHDDVAAALAAARTLASAG